MRADGDDEGAHCSLGLDIEEMENETLTHYRIVYKTIGKTLDTVRSIGKLITLLKQVVTGTCQSH